MMRFIGRPPVRFLKSLTSLSAFAAVRLPGTTHIPGEISDSFRVFGDRRELQMLAFRLLCRGQLVSRRAVC